MNINVALALLFALWSVAVLVAERKAIPKTAFTIFFAILIVLSFGSVFWSVEPAMTIVESLKLMNAAAMFFIAFIFVQKKQLSLHDLALTIAASAVFPIVIGGVQLLTGGGIATFDLHGRIHGTLAHPNVFAFFLVALMILLYEYRGAVSRRLRIPAFTLLTVLLLFTYTRAAYIGALLFFLVIGFVRAPKLVFKMFTGIFVFLALIIPLNNFLIEHADTDIAHNPFVERIATRNDDADSFAWRLSLLRESAPIIHKRPLVGYGFGTFAKVWEDSRGTQHFWDDSAEAHNDYMRLTLELGVVGLIAYIALFLSLLFHARKNITLATWIFMFIVVSFSENMLHHTPVIWLTFAWWGAQFGQKT